jgi:hypothetical protein
VTGHDSSSTEVVDHKEGSTVETTVRIETASARETTDKMAYDGAAAWLVYKQTRFVKENEDKPHLLF